MSLTYLNTNYLEQKIRSSNWWQKAANTIDSHYTNTSSIMLTHHLEAVYTNVEDIFSNQQTAFMQQMVVLAEQLKLNIHLLKEELKIIALLHDIGKTEEDKSQIIPHPLTGKPAHLRHGLVSLMATMEIIGTDIAAYPQQQTSIYRTVELHDFSYGMYREFKLTGEEPNIERLTHVSRKIHTTPGAGLLYLLLFKLADIHGHANIGDVIWFYTLAQKKCFNLLQLHLPIPQENNIR
jgi:hypothetical protein